MLTLYVTDRGIFSPATTDIQNQYKLGNIKRENTKKARSLDFLKNFLKSFHTNASTDTQPPNVDILPNHESDFSKPISFNRDQGEISGRKDGSPDRRKTTQLKRLRKPVLLTTSNISRKRFGREDQNDERTNFSQHYYCWFCLSKLL